jgi:hypothetical protein
MGRFLPPGTQRGKAATPKGFQPGAVHPEVVAEAGQACFFELDDVSSRPKAVTCRRTAK